jgi:hypothetical protein
MKHEIIIKTRQNQRSKSSHHRFGLKCKRIFIVNLEVSVNFIEFFVDLLDAVQKIREPSYFDEGEEDADEA